MLRQQSKDKDTICDTDANVEECPMLEGEGSLWEYTAESYPIRFWLGEFIEGREISGFLQFSSFRKPDTILFTGAGSANHESILSGILSGVRVASGEKQWSPELFNGELFNGWEVSTWKCEQSIPSSYPEKAGNAPSKSTAEPESLLEPDVACDQWSRSILISYER